MTDLQMRLVINSGVLAINVGWLFNNFYAGMTALLTCGFILSCIDYFKASK